MACQEKRLDVRQPQGKPLSQEGMLDLLLFPLLVGYQHLLARRCRAEMGNRSSSVYMVQWVTLVNSRR